MAGVMVTTKDVTYCLRWGIERETLLLADPHHKAKKKP